MSRCLPPLVRARAYGPLLLLLSLLLAVFPLSAQEEPAPANPSPAPSASPKPKAPETPFSKILGDSAAADLIALLTRGIGDQFQLQDAFGSVLSTEPRYGGRAPTGGPFSFTALPATITIVFWVKLPPGSAAAVLLGLGDPHDGYMMFANDNNGAPVMMMFGKNETTQTGRAPTGAANLADGKLHSIAMILDRGSGLTQMYVDGEPEFATVTTAFEMKRIGRAFAQWTLVDSYFGSQGRVFSPRVFGRALTQEEIAALKPGKAGPGDSFAQAMAKMQDFNESLFANTLAVFRFDDTPRVIPHRMARGGNTQ